MYDHHGKIVITLQPAQRMARETREPMSCTSKAGSCSISFGAKASNGRVRCSTVLSLSTLNSRSVIRVSPTVAPISIYWEPTVDNLRLADFASRRALTLSPELAEAQVSTEFLTSISAPQRSEQSSRTERGSESRRSDFDAGRREKSLVSH